MCTAAPGLTHAASSVLRIWEGTTDSHGLRYVPSEGCPLETSVWGTGPCPWGAAPTYVWGRVTKGQAGDAVPFTRNLTHWQLSNVSDARVPLSGRGVNRTVRLQIQCKKRLINLWCRVKCQRHQIHSCRGFALTLTEKG